MEQTIHERAGRFLLAVSLAVLLGWALSSAPAAADTIPVDLQAGSMTEGEVAVAANDLCSLIEAIENANDTVDGLIHADCVAGDPEGPDLVVLPEGATFTLDPAEAGDCFARNFDDTDLGLSGLPPITQPLTLEGNGSEIVRDEEAANCRILTVVDDESDDGALTLDDAAIRNGVTSGAGGNPDAVGGGLLTAGAGVTLDRVTVAGNTARSTNLGGGGLFSLFSEAALTLNRSTVSGNMAVRGGGIRCDNGSLTLNHSTVSGNTANGEGGGLRTFTSCPTTLTHTSVVNNSGSEGGGLFNSGGTVTLRNSLIAANSETGAGSPNCRIFNGTINLAGVNLTNDDSSVDPCGLTERADLVLNSADPKTGTLGDLADNGGPTQTHALLAGSSAIDTVDDGICENEPDQRGVVRGIDGDGDGSDDDLDGGCDVGAFEAGGLGPEALVVDAGGNGVLEPGEAAEVAATWRNLGAPPESPVSGLPPLVTGTAADLTGPAGAAYTLPDAEATYEAPPLDETASCQDSVDCYAVEITADGERPVPHWDASFEEVLDAGPSTHVWTLHLGDSFADVPRTHLFYRSVETSLHRGVTGGCSATEYCPAGQNTRGQLPVFVLRALQGPDFAPQPCVEGEETFADVPFDHPFCSWIEELARRDIVAGCGDDDYCPAGPVTRAQMAIFLLKTLLGGDYTPPECADVFADVACPSLFADWIEDLAARGITSGCSATDYCPADLVNRGQMAVFVAKTFGLTLYGP